MRVTDVLVAGFDRLIRPVTRAWCWTTGRSNFVLARVLLRLGLLFGVLDQIVWTFERPPDVGLAASVIGSTFGGLFMILWGWATVRRCRFLHELEREMESQDGTVSPKMLRVLRDRQVDAWYMVIVVVFVGLWGFEWAWVAWTCWASESFVASHVNSGGKSVFARANDAVKRAVSAVAEWVAPAPTPVPVRVG